jgi:hypothetical protein
MEEKIIKFIEQNGPLTGAELLASINGDPLILLRTCKLSEKLVTKIVGTRYLRLDRRIDGYARMSPSILREFLTYSIIGTSDDHNALERKACEIISHIEEISRSKSDLAYNIASSMAHRLGDEQFINEHACFIIAGDIVFNMAHDVPRPERSTGKMVKGSDMDMVVIVDDHFPEKMVKRIDEEIYKEKYSLLLNPYMKEEIDYVVKDLNRIRKQVKFDTFKHMVACKILHEGALLCGSEDIFHIVKSMLKDNGVTEKIAAMEEYARAYRQKAEEYLINEDPLNFKGESLDLFYPTEESEEFE